MPRPRSEKARQSVLAAMRSTLAAEGYAAVTIEGLAADAGVAKQTIYRWWPSKAEILGEALLEGSFPGEDVDVPFSDDLSADLRAWFAFESSALSTAEGEAVARALIAVMAKDADLGARLNERLIEPLRGWLIRRLHAAVDAGVVRADVVADVIADQFVALVSYSVLLRRPLSEESVSETVRLVMRAIE